MNPFQKNIKRRAFIRNISLASGGLLLGCNLKNDSNTELIDNANLASFQPNLFVELKSNGDLILTASRSEMGQGVRTSLTSVIADEMDADWSRVIVKQATGDDAYGNQNTDGSRSIRTIFEPMRNMGAMVRMMLISAAAKKWEVEKSECIASNHFILNKVTNEKLSYGDLAVLAAKEKIPKHLDYKPREDYNYIGKGLVSIDVDDFITGKATYGMDIKLEGMKYAVMSRCPVTFGKVKSVNTDQALKVKGVQEVFVLDRVEKPFGTLGGVVVVADNTWAAIKGKEALEIEWDYGDNQTYNTTNFLEKIKGHTHKKGKEILKLGNVQKAFSKASKIVEADYQIPHLAHTPMEVPNATASFKDDHCEIWAPVQAPQVTRTEVSDYLEVDLKNVTINVTFLGGGFGRKSKPDFVVEAAAISKKMNMPIQLVWTREDDVQNGYFHANSSQFLKASIDKDNKVTGWLHRSAYPSITSTFMPGVKYGAGFEFGQGMTNMPYEIDNILLENGEAEAHVRIGWLRSVYNIIHGFSINVFADELAVECEKDPAEFRLNLIGNDRIYPFENEFKQNTARLKNVLSKVTKNASWGKSKPKGYGVGLAVHYSFYSYVASVVEVSVINNKLKIHNVYTVIDCGRIVNSNTIKAQMEGAAMFGISLALYGKITTNNGKVDQSNFHDYKLLRMADAPNVHVEIVQSDEKSTGVGEPGVPVIAPAIVNAIYDATGVRYRNLPLSDYGLV